MAFVVEHFHNEAIVCHTKKHIQVYGAHLVFRYIFFFNFESQTADKTFFCKQCYKSFHKKSGLRNHMKTHRKDGDAEPVTAASNVVTIDTDGVKVTYVTEIYSDK